jgi:hypothetical protein|tara:strand:+ start:2399 stop:2587 length:189 start_codon:yes stop_codon:yes gene_type:complete
MITRQKRLKRTHAVAERYDTGAYLPFAMTDTEIGKLLGITNDAVRKTRLRAERKIRERWFEA